VVPRSANRFRRLRQLSARLRLNTRSFLSLSVLTVCLVLPGAALASHGGRVYVSSCGGHHYEPRQIVISCGDGGIAATTIRYSSYGAQVAVGSSVFRENDCSPSCAEGDFHNYRGTLRLIQIVHCADGRLYYSRLRYHFSGPAGTGTANITPYSCDAQSALPSSASFCAWIVPSLRAICAGPISSSVEPADAAATRVGRSPTRATEALPTSAHASALRPSSPPPPRRRPQGGAHRTPRQLPARTGTNRL
jgi:hypothetical protein